MSLASSTNSPRFLEAVQSLHHLCLRMHVTKVSREFSIKTFISRHHLPRQAQEDLLDLIRLHLLPSHVCSSFSSSVFTLRKNSLIHPVAAQSELHYLCPQCLCILPTNHSLMCPNTDCGLLLDDHLGVPYFLTVSIAEQLQLI